MRLTYAELFAGAGGLSRGLEAAGFQCAAHAEIEPHARAVLRKQWPGVRLDGDVTQVNGADYAGITLLSGGSPCQDLSVAGKRKGLAGARSGLFHEQVRIWNESGAPYFLWENVLGALSSNAGSDFAVVLSTLVGAPLTVPADGWRRAGVAAGPSAVAAWRVLDLQHFGPPQRRVRIFVLAARAGGVDPAEVLALSEGVCGHPSPREQSRENIAAGAGGGAAARSVGYTVTNSSNRAGWLTGDVSGTVCASGHNESSGLQNGVLAFESTGGSWGVNEGDTAPPIKIGTGLQIASPPAVVSFAENQRGELRTGEVVRQITTGGGKPEQGFPAVMVMSETGHGFWTEGEPLAGLRADGGGGSPPHVVCITGDSTHALTHEGADSSEDGTGRGTPIVLASGQANAETVIGGAPTLTTIHEAPIVVGTLDAHDATKWGSHQWEDQGKCMVSAGRPRRLTPLECERLMSWPDQWTAVGVDENGREYPLSDTARYRLCGNGVGSVQVQWIADRLASALRAG